MFSKLLFAITAVAVAVNAQSGTVTSSAASASSSSVLNGLSQCVLTCLESVSTVDTCQFTDAACVCASAQFQADAAACLTQHCTAADLAAADALQQSECSAVGVTPTGSATTINSVPFTSAAASATSAASSKAASSGAASSKAASSGAAGSASATSPATSSTAKASSAGALAGNNGVVAVFGAVLAGVLAL